LYDFVQQNNNKFSTINLQNAETLKGVGKRMYDAAKMSQMRKLGVRDTLDSFVEAPPAIMEILYGHHQIHNIVLGDGSMENNIQRLEPLLSGPQGYLALCAAQDGPNPKVQIVSRFQAYVSRYGNKDTTTATTRRQYSSQKLPALDDGNNDDKARLEADVKKAERALDAATKTAERLEKEADVKTRRGKQHSTRAAAPRFPHTGQAVRRRRRGQEGPGRGQGFGGVQQGDAEQGCL
jgi:hypothetical protein